MKQIGVSLSPHQRRRLHSGQPVRVKQGSGIMMVNPANFGLMSKTFLRHKAKEIQLSPEEIMANKMISPEAHSNIRSELASEEQQVAPITSTISGGRVSNAGGPRGLSTMSGLKQVSEHLQSLGDYTGGNYGYQLKAGLGNLMANDVMAGVREAKSAVRKNILGGGRKSFYDNEVGASSFGGFGVGRTMGQIGVAGNLLANQRRTPQALQSQPYAENYQFSQTLPPAYQKYNRGK